MRQRLHVSMKEAMEVFFEAKEDDEDEKDAALPESRGKSGEGVKATNASTFPVGTVPDDAVKIFLDAAHQWLV